MYQHLRRHLVRHLVSCAALSLRSREAGTWQSIAPTPTKYPNSNYRLPAIDEDGKLSRPSNLNMPGHSIPIAESSTPSSSRSPVPIQTPADSADERDDGIDPFWVDQPENDLLVEDPLSDTGNEPITFKRRQKRSMLSSPARFFAALTNPGGSSRHADEPQSPSLSSPDGNTILRGIGARRSDENTYRGGYHPKEGAPLDWYVEGPGRRVAYENLTAIDWIFEYTKERQRLRVLRSSASGLLGYIQLLLDASQVWVILILTGIATGCLAAGIQVTTNWLGDLKTGFCSGGMDGGAFYLSKASCCLGYDQGSKCLGWSSWGEAMGVHSSGGKWFLEYLFFILFSVRRSPLSLSTMSPPSANIVIRSFLRILRQL